MLRNRLIAFLVLLVPCLCMSAPPVSVIFDTDMGNDVDDAVALAILHALESRGEARILAVTITKDHPEAAVYVDVVNTFYGRGGIPIGVVKNGKTPEPGKMLHIPLTARAENGALLYPRRVMSGNELPDAVAVLRKTLSEAEDASVVMVQVGFSTNLARLLDSPADAISPLTGRELAARKVRLLSAMAGQFPTGKPEYNVRIDIASARKVFSEWPSPIVASGFEIGASMKMPAASVERDMAWTKHHPVADAYRAYSKMPYDRPTWDPTAALYAVRAGHGYFGLSAPGRILVDDAGRTTFEAAPDGKHRYLTVNEPQKARALEAMVQLATQPATQSPNSSRMRWRGVMTFRPVRSRPDSAAGSIRWTLRLRCAGGHHAAFAARGALIAHAESLDCGAAPPGLFPTELPRYPEQTSSVQVLDVV